MAKEKIIILYTDNCNPTYKEFKSAKKAYKFAKKMATASKAVQDNEKYLTGVVVGAYHAAKLDYKETDLLKAIKKQR